jgi:hypothetical protein
MDKQLRRLKELAGQPSNIDTNNSFCSITKQFFESEISENLKPIGDGKYADMSPADLTGGDFINYQGHKLLWWFRGRTAEHEAKESPEARANDDKFPVGYRNKDFINSYRRERQTQYGPVGEYYTIDADGNEVSQDKRNAWIRTLDFNEVHELGSIFFNQTIKEHKAFCLMHLNKVHPDILPDNLLVQFMTEMGLGDQVKDKAANLKTSSANNKKSSDKDDSETPGTGSAKAKGISNPTIQAYQKELIAAGVLLPKYGADGIWGSETSGASKNPKAKAINQKYAGKIKQLSGMKESSELEAMLRIAGLR